MSTKRERIDDDDDDDVLTAEDVRKKYAGTRGFDMAMIMPEPKNFHNLPKDLKHFIAKLTQNVRDFMSLTQISRFVAAYARLEEPWRLFFERDFPREYSLFNGSTEAPVFVPESDDASPKWKRFYLFIRKLYVGFVRRHAFQSTLVRTFIATSDSDLVKLIYRDSVRKLALNSFSLRENLDVYFCQEFAGRCMSSHMDNFLNQRILRIESPSSSWLKLNKPYDASMRSDGTIEFHTTSKKGVLNELRRHVNKYFNFATSMKAYEKLLAENALPQREFHSRDVTTGFFGSLAEEDRPSLERRIEIFNRFYKSGTILNFYAPLNYLGAPGVASYRDATMLSFLCDRELILPFVSQLNDENNLEDMCEMFRLLQNELRTLRREDNGGRIIVAEQQKPCFVCGKADTTLVEKHNHERWYCDEACLKKVYE
jgi:hypothetical protein